MIENEDATDPGGLELQPGEPTPQTSPRVEPAAVAPVPPQAAPREDRPLLRRLFTPRATREQQPQYAGAAVIRRPQRTLTRDEHEVVRGTALLNLQGALIMGIVDPVPNPSPMTEEQGAWVREHAWPGHWKVIERKYPWGFQRWSTCERGTCWNCLYGRCELCVHRQQGGPHVDSGVDWVRNQQGRVVAQLILRPGGEPCVWWCRCPCPKDGPLPADPPAQTAPDPAPAARTAAAAPSTTTTRDAGAAAAQPTLW